MNKKEKFLFYVSGGDSLAEASRKLGLTYNATYDWRRRSEEFDRAVRRALELGKEAEGPTFSVPETWKEAYISAMQATGGKKLESARRAGVTQRDVRASTDETSARYDPLFSKELEHLTQDLLDRREEELLERANNGEWQALRMYLQAHHENYRPVRERSRAKPVEKPDSAKVVEEIFDRATGNPN